MKSGHDFPHVITTSSNSHFALLFSEEQTAEATQSHPISDCAHIVLGPESEPTQIRYNDQAELLRLRVSSLRGWT